MIVMTVNVLEQTPNMFTQGIIHNQCRSVFRKAHAFRLVKHIFDPTIIDLLLEPVIVREVPRQVGLIGALDNTPGNIRHAFVGQHHQPREIVFKVLKLAAILEQISEGLCMGSHKWRRCDNW
ncbi:MAG: hypothetical protein QME66_13340 [Candidatus Eisenbacteria bacterium]|nr:hypothetical protein [Candidatus Eisenbacteria bacterium]